MKITEISSDGLGASALIAAAGAVNDLLRERNVDVALIKDGDDETLAVFSRRGTEVPILAVTVETNPRLSQIKTEIDD